MNNSEAVIFSGGLRDLASMIIGALLAGGSLVFGMKVLGFIDVSLSEFSFIILLYSVCLLVVTIFLAASGNTLVNIGESLIHSLTTYVARTSPFISRILFFWIVLTIAYSALLVGIVFATFTLLGEEPFREVSMLKPIRQTSSIITVTGIFIWADSIIHSIRRRFENGIQ